MLFRSSSVRRKWWKARSVCSSRCSTPSRCTAEERRKISRARSIHRPCRTHARRPSQPGLLCHCFTSPPSGSHARLVPRPWSGIGAGAGDDPAVAGCSLRQPPADLCRRCRGHALVPAGRGHVIPFVSVSAPDRIGLTQVAWRPVEVIRSGARCAAHLVPACTTDPAGVPSMLAGRDQPRAALRTPNPGDRFRKAWSR